MSNETDNLRKDIDKIYSKIFDNDGLFEKMIRQETRTRENARQIDQLAKHINDVTTNISALTKFQAEEKTKDDIFERIALKTDEDNKFKLQQKRTIMYFFIAQGVTISIVMFKIFVK